MTAPTTIASLDLACFLQIVMARRSTLTPAERERARAYVIRGLAVLCGRQLPTGAEVDRETALAAFDAICAAIVAFGISNAELAARFNRGAIDRTH